MLFRIHLQDQDTFPLLGCFMYRPLTKAVVSPKPITSVELHYDQTGSESCFCDSLYHTFSDYVVTLPHIMSYNIYRVIGSVSIIYENIITLLSAENLASQMWVIFMFLLEL